MKKFLPLALAVVLAGSMALPVSAAGTPDTSVNTFSDASIEDVFQEKNADVELTTMPVTLSNLTLDQGRELTLGNQDVAVMSANSITNKYEGTIAEEGQFQYVTLTLGENQIVQATLENPKNANLNYDLLLCTVSDTGSLNIVSSCMLGTYIDPQTGKTLDDSLSYIHADATPGAYAILVMATQGSSTTDPFYLTLSLDVAGSYDSFEPDNNPFVATSIDVGDEVSASLNVANDEDWYVVSNENPGVFSANAGDYETEIYYANSNSTLALAERTADGYYTLYEGTYYVKVYSKDDINSFVYGDYTLTLQDESQSSTFETAYNMGYWQYAGLGPNIPDGQPIAYYRFTVNAGDKIYAYVNRYDESGIQVMELYDKNGNYITSANSENPDDVVTNDNGITKLVINADGISNGQVFYLAVARNDPQNYLSSMQINLRDRTRNGRGTFEFIGTAYNGGYGYSNILTLNLTNEGSIPPNAILTDAQLDYHISDSVGGVKLQLNPGGDQWFEELGGAGTAFFDIDKDMGIKAHVPLYFRYYQSAFMPTEIYDVTVNLQWEYDIQYTGYDEWE